MTSVNTVAARTRISSRTAVPEPVSGDGARGSAAVVEVIPLWAAPRVPVLPVARGR
ncbi:hypothetical protein GCM10009639_42460 [Kitasatospora putterlickiae]|uniref:Uncharacterized protein n=1 Tax=Kitasatospora putterlickiae TaxID=221725 RepID=A0ABP4J0E8_9ACTN